MQKLYLYDNVESGNNCCVVRTSPPVNGGPGYCSENCSEFSEIVWEVLNSCLSKQEFEEYFGEGYNHYNGWTRMQAKHREKFILGCLANDIDLEIIE